MPPPIDDDRSRYNRSMVGGVYRHSVEINNEMKNQLLQTIKNRENFAVQDGGPIGGGGLGNPNSGYDSANGMQGLRKDQNPSMRDLKLKRKTNP